MRATVPLCLVLASSAASIGGCFGPARSGLPQVAKAYGFPQQIVASSGGHAYVATQSGVFRFRMSGGIPANEPDLTIPNVSGPLAADTSGVSKTVLYALGPSGGAVNAFGLGATSPNRTIYFPRLHSQYSWTVTGLAVDSKGYLYAGLQAFAYDARGRRESPAGPYRAVLIYGPAANGRAKPVRTITGFPGILDGLALDSHDRLYAFWITQHIFYDECWIYADPRTGPKHIGTFDSSKLGNLNGETIYGNLLYASTFVFRPHADFEIVAFPVSSRGNVSPVIDFTAGNGSVVGQLARNSAALFVAAESSSDTLWLFKGKKDGMEDPFDSIPFGQPLNGVALGN